MTAGVTHSVLHKMVETGRDSYQARAVSLAKALRLSSAKVADEAFDMALSMIGYSEDLCAGDDIENVFDDADLLVLLDGPDRRRGAAAFDSAFVGALIQQQTMGQILAESPDAAPRMMTATDAAMMAPFVDDLLTRAEKLPERQEDRQLIEGFRFGAHGVDSRVVGLALDGQEYSHIRLTFDLAKGARQGVVQLVLPVHNAAAESLVYFPDKDEVPGQGPAKLENIVMGLEANLKVALTQLTMPLAAARQLVPGGVVDLGINGLEAAMLLTPDGRLIARGQLGQVQGLRALQLAVGAPQAQHAFDLEPDKTIEGVLAGNSALPSSDPLEITLEEGGALDDLGQTPDIEESSIPELSDLPDISDLPELPSLDDLPPLDLEAG